MYILTVYLYTVVQQLWTRPKFSVILELQVIIVPVLDKSNSTFMSFNID